MQIRMNELKLTNTFVANEVGLSTIMISSLNNSKRNIEKLDVKHALKLASVLQISVEILLNN